MLEFDSRLEFLHMLMDLDSKAFKYVIMTLCSPKDNRGILFADQSMALLNNEFVKLLAPK